MTAFGTVLGIESSCDDSAAAVVRSDKSILASVVTDQKTLHAAFGGIVPEIAARAHAEKLDVAVEAALEASRCSLSDVDAIAVTAGPGLIGGVLSGVMLARGLAAGAGKPLLGINHLVGHALTPRLTHDVGFPYLMLLASGGHCQYLIVKGPDTFDRIGGTIDDAPGESFDKIARQLGLSQPGGPAVEAAAKRGDPTRFEFPRPLLSRPGCDMSFSGLKTAVLRERDKNIQKKGGISTQDRDDVCAGFQAAVSDVLAEKSRRAIVRYLSDGPAHPAFAFAGGVASNKALRKRLETISADMGLQFVAPPAELCTDNAAMIAWAGIELSAVGHPGMNPLVPRARWPLDKAALALIGSGKKGAKA
ncbi:MAG: tRNA (adenosine(37)-N6)-threonylcarbamoyltransferase complex transferase subunit TsaD [Boseongicola sp.]